MGRFRTVACAAAVAATAMTFAVRTRGCRFDGPAWEPDPASVTVASAADGTGIDTGTANEGYVSARTVPGTDAKLLVEHAGGSFSCDIGKDGVCVAPMSMGNGRYTVSVMRHSHGSGYLRTATAEVDVSLASEDAPWKVPNAMCDYAEDGACEREAAEAVERCHGDGRLTQSKAAYAIITQAAEAFDYDYAKADACRGTSGYVPDPDATAGSHSGICIDAASMTCAMLRSQGIPARIVTGRHDGEAHAWVEVRTEGGADAPRFCLRPGEWTPIDVTAMASGSTETDGMSGRYAPEHRY